MPPRIDYSRNIRLLLRESSGRINGAHEWMSLDARARVLCFSRVEKKYARLLFLLEAKQQEKSLHTHTEGGGACFFFDYIISILHNDKF